MGFSTLALLVSMMQPLVTISSAHTRIRDGGSDVSELQEAQEA